MAVISAPPKPTGLEVEVRPDKSLVIHWEGTEGQCYELEFRYFELGGPMVEHKYSAVIERRDLKAHVQHSEELAKLKAEIEEEELTKHGTTKKLEGWVVKVGLRAKSDGLFSDAVVKQAAWDEEQSPEGTQADLQTRIDDLRLKQLQDFVDVKREMPNFLLVGGQHHGKSSLVNHLYRCFQCNLSINDQMEIAPAGIAEKTVETKSLAVPLSDRSGSCIKVIDTPAFANMSEEAAGKLRTLCSSGIEDGTRRSALGADERSLFSKPPHGAVVVVSLCHWRDHTDEMQSYLQKMAEAFKAASGGKVAFPYVVACTHRDVYLMECQKEDPAKELQKVVDGIKTAALTEHVYSLTSYKKKGLGSARNNEETFDLLSQLLTLAKNENTAKHQQDIRWYLCLCLGLFLLVIVPPMGLAILLILVATSGNESTKKSVQLDCRWVLCGVLVLLLAMLNFT